MNPESGDVPAPLTDAEVDERFAGLVSGWAERADAAEPTNPAEPTDPDPATGLPDHPVLPTPPPGPSITFSIPVWRGADSPTIDEILDAEEAEGFTPPPVTLPPGEDLHYWGAVVGLVLGPLVVIWTVFAEPFYATWWLLGGIALFVAGFGLLVLRGPLHRDPEDDDTGARV